LFISIGVDAEYKRRVSGILCEVLISRYNPFNNNRITYINYRNKNEIDNPELFMWQYVPADRNFIELTGVVDFDETASITECLKSKNIEYYNTFGLESDDFSDFCFYGKN
jgi:hypothetical protein